MTVDSVRRAAPAGRGQRLLALDNLRTFLTLLVIGHHSAIAFGAAGGWYFVIPPPPGSIAPLVLTLFTGVNQAFFMSLFFAIAGYFTPGAYDGKGPAAFLRDRLLRLGLPLVIYTLVLNPCVVYLARRLQGRTDEGLLAFVAGHYGQVVGTGPLWFVLSLLLFAGAYAALRRLAGRARERTGTRPFPDDRWIAAFVLGIGSATFLVRLAFPVGWQVLGLQVGYFPLYVALFVFGIWAHGNGWLEALGAARARPWFRAALVAIVAMPLVIVAGNGMGAGADRFRGGPSWQALVYALWEPILCVGLSMKLIVLFRERFAEQGRIAQHMARSAYGAYIVHPFFVVGGTALLAALPLPPLVQFLALWGFAGSAAFAVSDGLRRAPGLDRIL